MENNILNNIWPEWRVVKRIGRGSFGVVYEAVRTDHLVESRAAIKVISIPQNESEIASLRSEGLSKDATGVYLQGVVSDFIGEIQLMESLKGVQNIVSVEDYKVVKKQNGIGWDIYIRMELLVPFNSYICNKTPSEKEIIKLGIDICTALELCAKRHIIHRDVKPENIFINQFGDFKLGDFGIARKLGNVTGVLSQKGTYNYMAPEIERGNQYDSTVDLYSLGLVLYRFMNKNRLPFLDTQRQLLNPNERMAAVRRRINGELLPAPCDASPAMAQVILCACAYDPSRRFSSATAMKNALISIKNGSYNESQDQMNKAMSVCDAPLMQDLNKTISAYQAPQDQKTIYTFGEKKKSRVPFVIIAVFAALLAVGGGTFFVLGLSNSTESNVVQKTRNSVSTENDDGKIEDVIKKAEEFVADKDYESALTEIRNALVTYPKSKDLHEKETKYMDALAEQVKTKTLKDAAKVAESGDYISAMKMIKNAQDTDGENYEYQQAYEIYKDSYKIDIINKTDALAGSGDYTNAILDLNKATAVLGDDEKITKKIQEYTSKQQDETLVSPSSEENSENSSRQYSLNPFYGIWCAGTKDLYDAQNSVYTLSQKGFHAQIFVTTDWSNLNNEEWYVVTAGIYTTEEEANIALPGVQSIYADAYVKYSGDYIGNSSSMTELQVEQPNSAQEEHPSFYGVWCAASKNYDDAQSSADAMFQSGFHAQVFVTTDWSNLNSEEWYIVTAGVYSTEEEAKVALSSVQSICPGAYVKYSGEWQG